MALIAILDVDGTLVDTNYHHAIAWYRAFRSRGATFPLWRIHRHIGMGGDQLVAALDARDLADSWTTSADVEATKPAPDLVEVALEKAGDHDGAVMVGDSTYDCEAAQRAGVPTLGVLTGGFSEQELLDAGAVSVFESPEELLSEIGRTPFAG